MSTTKREIQYIYGEKTVPLNIRVPESKKDEIDSFIKEKLKEYINPKTIEIEVVSKRVRNIEVVDPVFVKSEGIMHSILQDSGKNVLREMIRIGESGIEPINPVNDGSIKSAPIKMRDISIGEKKSTAKQSNDSNECGPEELPEYRVIDSMPAKATEVKKGVSNLREFDGKWFTQIYAGGKFEYREYYDLTKAKLYVANNFKK